MYYKVSNIAILGLVPCFNLLSKFSFVYLLNSEVGINLSCFMARFFLVLLFLCCSLFFN